MNQHFVLHTQEAPLAALRTFIHALYTQTNLNGLLLPVVDETLSPPGITLRFIQDPDDLDSAALLTPYMLQNAASLLPALLRDHPKARIGAVLRACEMRALATLLQREALDASNLQLIGTDCLGTHPMDNDTWLEDLETLTNKTLKFARQGGIATYRYRPACQMCVSPVCDLADINIGVVGLPVHRVILISAKDEATALAANLKSITCGKAPADLITQREAMRLELEQRRQHTKDRLLQALVSDLAAEVDAFIAHLASCDTCHDSLLNCPICTSGESIYAPDGTISKPAVMTWLSECVGCGMCEQAAAGHLPLTAIVQTLQQKLTNPQDAHLIADR